MCPTKAGIGVKTNKTDTFKWLNSAVKLENKEAIANQYKVQPCRQFMPKLNSPETRKLA